MNTGNESEPIDSWFDVDTESLRRFSRATEAAADRLGSRGRPFPRVDAVTIGHAGLALALSKFYDAHLGKQADLACSIRDVSTEVGRASQRYERDDDARAQAWSDREAPR